MVADPSELCGTAGDLLIYELAEFRLLSSTRSDKKLSILSDVQLGRWLKKWQILFLLMTTVVADSHLINLTTLRLLCNLPSDKHMTYWFNISFTLYKTCMEILNIFRIIFNDNNCIYKHYSDFKLLGTGGSIVKHFLLAYLLVSIVK